MTLDFFAENYDLTDMEIKSAEIRDNKLVLDTVVKAYLELIANGYRPELDVEHEIVFTFGVNSKDKKYKNPVIKNVCFKENTLIMDLNGDAIAITENKVDVYQKE